MLGHIDFIQAFSDRIIILDYKPAASKEKHVAIQLFVYAIALSTRTRIHLQHIDCAWFDDKDYYRFSALKLYHKFKNGQKSTSITQKHQQQSKFIGSFA